MDGKKWILAFLLLYLVLGGITVGVYAADTGYLNLAGNSGKASGKTTVADADKASGEGAWEKITESEAAGISPPEQVVLTPAPEVAEETNAPETVTVESPETETAATEPTEPENTETATESEGDPAESEPAESEDASDTEADEAVTDTGEEGQIPIDESKLTEGGTDQSGPVVYYRYIVTEIPFEDLAVHPDVDGHNGQIGYLKPGMTGYVIGRGQWRTLIAYEGKFGYISNKYSNLAEVSAEEYPEELKEYSWDGSVAAAAKLKGDIPAYVNGDTEELKTETGTH